MATRRRKAAPSATPVSRWEWIAAGLGSAALAAVFGYMIYYGLTRESGPPSVSVAVREISPSASGYLVRFTARNVGGATAAGLRIRGVLEAGNRPVETRVAVIDYLPPHAQREGGFFFARDPRAYRLEIRPEGYERP